MTTGVPIVTCLYQDCTNSVPIVKNSQKTVKQQKNGHWCTNRHVYTESAEYTKPRKRRYLARPRSHVPGQWPQPVAHGQGLLCVYMDVHASGSRSLPRAATALFYLLMMPAARLVC